MESSMRKVTLAVTFCLAATVGAVNAQAQPLLTPTIYCVPGSGGNCFAAAWQYTSANTFSLWMQNLQGTYGDGTPGFEISRIWVARSNDFSLHFVNLCSSPFQGAEGSVVEPPFDVNGCFYNVLSSGLPWEQLDFPFHRALYVAHAGVNENGIAGCDPVGNFMVATCPRDGTDGWWRIDFSTGLQNHRTGETRPSTVDDFGLAIAGCNIFIGANSGVSLANPEMGTVCETAPFSVLTPEPSTVLMLGTGLLGLAGVAVTRRRRRSP
jgi:hypothetical protein